MCRVGYFSCEWQVVHANISKFAEKRMRQMPRNRVNQIQEWTLVICAVKGLGGGYCGFRGKGVPLQAKRVMIPVRFQALKEIGVPRIARSTPKTGALRRTRQKSNRIVRLNINNPK